MKKRHPARTIFCAGLTLAVLFLLAFARLLNQIMNNKKDTKNQPGWDAITAAFESVYPGQRNPRHYAPPLPLVAGGNDPLDGISVYDDGDCWHFVGYGLSDLYGKQGDDPEYSGFGVEYTLRLKKAGLGDAQSEERELKCVCALLQTLARLAYQGEIFQPFECLYTGQKEGIDAERKSNITGCITVPDTRVSGVDTPDGHVDFVLFIGMTDAELRALADGRYDVRELYEKYGSDLTDYQRYSVC